MILDKKGDINLLFKWIFGVVAGAVLLVFFIRLSYIHLSGGETLEGQLLLVDVDDRLDALGIGEGNDLIDLKDDFTLGFTCGKILTGDFDRSTDKVVFAPEKMQGDALHVWTKKWQFPFGVTTFFYLNNPGNRVLLIADASKIEDIATIANAIPKDFAVQTTTKQLFQPASFASQAKGSEKLTLVFFGAPTYTVEQLKAVYGQGVTLEVVSVNLEEHTAKIYDNQGNAEDVFYLGDAMLYGLMFSGSGYSCTKDIAIARLRALTAIYSEKVGRLMGKVSNNQQCVDLLNQARILLEQYTATSSKDEFYSISEALDKQNRKLEKEGCPAVY